MTVVLALACLDGVVLSSDSQATESNHTRFDVQKVFPLTDKTVWAASGAVAIIQDIKHTLELGKARYESGNNLTIEFRQMLKPVFIRHYSTWVPCPGLQSTPPATTVLACGVRPDGSPWIIEVDPNNVVSDP